MASSWRWIYVLSLACCATFGALAAATTPEDRAFEAAAKSFQDGFYPRAEKEFAEFIQAFPNAYHVAEASLFQAEARIKQGNFSGAIDLLAASKTAGGTLADQYLFWLGEAYLGKGDYELASQTFGKLINDLPASSRLLEAALEQAVARARLAKARPDQWPQVVKLLQETNGAFQTAARTNAGNELVFRGDLLLSDALMAQHDYTGAEAALRPFEKSFLSPTNAWQWQYAICRIQVAAGRTEDALASSSNLLTMASNTQQPALQAESAAFKANLLEKMGRPEEAIAAHTNNLVEGIPVERQRQALLKVTELSLKQGKLNEAAQKLHTFVTRFPGAPVCDLAWLTIGELRLRQYDESVAGTNAVRSTEAPGSTTNSASGTNLIALAQAAFETMLTNFPQSSLSGKAQLGLGWCFWRRDNLPESRKAFETAVRLLPASNERAVAHFKLGDVAFRQQDFAGALSSYQALVEGYAAVPEFETNLVEFALYQMVRAGLAATNFPAATTALGKILAWYPNGFHTERAVLLAGQTVGQEGNPVEARRIYSEFIKAAPDAPLRPELELAMARTYEQEGAWTNALDLYETWLGAHTNSEACAQAEYCHALALAHSGEPTNALVSLTNFVARFPTNELTPLAQWWVADFFFKNGAYTRAENDYQVLATTWPGTQLAYEARMMAGRSAVAHYGWGDAAKYYFVPLWNDTNCPVHLRFQALYALGDTLVSQDSTNKLADFQEAFSAFDKICQLYSTNELAVLACGAKANCLLQWALSSAQVTNTITNASLAFEQVLTNAQASVAARSTAKVGLGLVLEKEAAQKPATEQLALRQQALDEYLDVFYKKILRPGEEPDLFWMKKACLEAGRLASELGHWSEARSVYERLGELLPELRSSLQERIRKAQEKENVARTGN